MQFVEYKKQDYFRRLTFKTLKIIFFNSLPVPIKFHV